MFFSVIIPVYNRPDELNELLQSINNQSVKDCFEVIIVEDGSKDDAEHVVLDYKNLNIKYFYKTNTGPGDSRNFGMKQAKGDFLLLFDSDCVLPLNYFENLINNLNENPADFFGGDDNDDHTFEEIQRAINFVMTSWITTAKVRGNDSKKFQPRSFNMGLSKACFETSGGFSNIHPGEDPDLVFRLWKLGFKSKFYSNITVLHKRRINYKQFYTQINKFGKVRAILDVWHKEYTSKIFWLPAVFMFGLLSALLLFSIKIYFLLCVYVIYTILIFISASIKLKSLRIASKTIIVFFIQMSAYSLGYLNSKIQVGLLKNSPEKSFPNLFFKT